jgi:hypothetical protein
MFTRICDVCSKTVPLISHHGPPSPQISSFLDTLSSEVKCVPSCEQAEERQLVTEHQQREGAASSAVLPYNLWYETVYVALRTSETATTCIHGFISKAVWLACALSHLFTARIAIVQGFNTVMSSMKHLPKSPGVPGTSSHPTLKDIMFNSWLRWHVYLASVRWDGHIYTPRQLTNLNPDMSIWMCLEKKLQLMTWARLQVALQRKMQVLLPLQLANIETCNIWKLAGCWDKPGVLCFKWLDSALANAHVFASL